MNQRWHCRTLAPTKYPVSTTICTGYSEQDYFKGAADSINVWDKSNNWVCSFNVIKS